MVNFNIDKGKLLIADPSILSDMFFNRSTVLLVEHNVDGTIGFILNKPLQFKLNELIPEIEIEFNIFNGGPVEQDNLYFIHNVPNLIANSILVTDEIYWCGDFEIIKRLINNKEIDESNIQFYLGYTGWASGQLLEEIKSKFWVLDKNEIRYDVLNKNYLNLWKDKIQELGGEYLIWSNAPENPLFN